MPITLNDFKEGGSLRNFITQVGLLGKIEKEGVDKDKLLDTLINAVTMTGAYTDSNKDGKLTKDDAVSEKFSKKEDGGEGGEGGDDPTPTPTPDPEPDPEPDPDAPGTPTIIPDGYTPVENPEDIPTEDTTTASVALVGNNTANSINSSDTVFQNLMVADAEVSSNVYYSANTTLTVENIEVSGEQE